MTVISDMSDEGLVNQFGDLMQEMPELFEALRRFEMQNRPLVISGGFKMRSDWVSMQSVGNVPRIRVRNARG